MWGLGEDMMLPPWRDVPPESGSPRGCCSWARSLPCLEGTMAVAWLMDMCLATWGLSGHGGLGYGGASDTHEVSPKRTRGRFQGLRSHPPKGLGQ